MPPRKNYLLNSGRSRGFARASVASSFRGSGGSSFAPDPNLSQQENWQALQAYNAENATEGPDPKQQATQNIARLLRSPDEKQKKMGREALRNNLGLIDEQTALELGIAEDVAKVVSEYGGDSLGSQVGDRILSDAAKVLEVVGRPSEAVKEVIQAGAADLGIIEGVAGESVTKRGGYRDAIRALVGKDRYDPVTGQQVRYLPFSRALGRQDREGAGGKVIGAASFVGDVAVDPLNFLGGGSKGAAQSVARVAAREILEEGGEEVLTRALRRQIAKQGSQELSEETLTAAINRIGLRKATTSEQRQAIQARIQAAVPAAVTTRSGREVPLKGDTGLGAGFRLLTARQPREGAERAAEKQIQSALAYDRGGLRVRGLSLTPRSGRPDKVQVLGSVPAAEKVMAEKAGREQVLEAIAEKKLELGAKAEARYNRLGDQAFTQPQARMEARLEDVTAKIDELRASLPEGLINAQNIPDDLREELTRISYTIDEAAANPLVYEGASGEDLVPYTTRLLGEYADEFRTLVAEERYYELAELIDTRIAPRTFPTWGVLPAREVTSSSREAAKALRGESRNQEQLRKKALQELRKLKKAERDLQAEVAKGPKADKATVSKLFDTAEKARNYYADAAEMLDEADALRSATTAEEALAIDPGLGSALTPIREIQPRTRAGSIIAMQTGEARRGAQRAFQTGARIRQSPSLPAEVEETVRRFSSEGRAFKNAEGRRLTQAVTSAAKKAADEGFEADDIPRMLEGFDKGGDVGVLVRSLQEGGRPEAANYAKILDALRRETKLRIIDSELGVVEKLQGDNYLTRFFTPEGRKAILEGMERGVPGLERFSQMTNEVVQATRQGGHLMAREINPEWGIKQMNDHFGEILGEAGLLPEGAKLLEEDVAQIITRRALEVVHAEEAAKMIDRVSAETSDILGQPVLKRISQRYARDNPKQAARMASDLKRRGLVKVDLGEAGEAWTHPDLRDDVFNYYRMISSDEEIKKFLQTIDGLNRLWKAYATVPLLGTGFTFKNTLGNKINNYFKNVQFSAYAEALPLQVKVNRVRKRNPDIPIPEALSQANATQREVAIVEGALERGVIDEAFFRIDLGAEDITPEIGTKSRVEKIWSKVPTPKNAETALGVPTGRKFNEFFEDWDRLAHFISKTDELGDMDLAAASVREALFDYGDLTNFEQRALKRIHAFYTFTRKNTPFQIANLANNPGALNRILLLERNVRGDDDTEGDVPDYFGDAYGQPTRRGLGALLGVPEGDTLFTNMETTPQAAADFLSPVAGLLSGSSEGRQKAAQAALNTPSGFVPEAFKFLAEEGLNVNVFTGSPVYDQFGNRKQPLPIRAAQVFVPAVGKANTALGRPFEGEPTESLKDRLTKELGLRAFRLVTGAQAGVLTDERREQATRQRERELFQIIEELESRGEEVPTIADLRRLGIVPPRARE